jgi:hypothetical protein
MKPCLTRLSLFLSTLALVAAPLAAATPAAQAGGTAVSCAHPRFVTSDPNGMWSDGQYIVHNNMWNASSYAVSERLRACSPSNWSVTATADNSSHDGAVKTYPNVHRDYHDWDTGHEPAISSFRSIRSSFAARTPHVGIYDAAYDIWLNGVPGNREVMIWTENFHQTPAGSVVARGLHFSHRTWRVYASDSHSLISFLPNKPLLHGSIGIKQRLTWLVGQGLVQQGSTLGQVDFGFEVVSTDGTPARFKVDRFSVTSSRR